ncbi:alanine racemase [Gemella sp. zg-570]|uniref:alanine racemase n=1 Tax=Gemella sp. zg-570 TaxID=2840371 RepID=UPI001C0CB0E2|nr:alanine racemase [Gemella sp. zg-570]QWQ38406.1 alanine racemase [Gemella sp. zg-570]
MALLEINYQNIIKNVEQLKNNEKKIIAVVKNNAYNMGLEDVVKTLYKIDVNYFATTNIKEAIKIREILGEEVNIFLFNANYDFDILEKYNIEANIPNINYLKTNLKKLKNINLQLEFSGSMRRAGAKNLKEVIDIINFCKENKLKLKGFWSHFAFADEFDGLYEEEKKLVLEVYNFAKKIYKFEVVHLQNSASFLRDGSFEEVTHIRPGIMIYGSYPYNVKNNPSKISYTPYQAFSVKANVINMVTLKKGECIGYSNSYIADKEKQVAVVDIGYGDGILRARLTGKTCLIKNKEYKILSTMMSHIVVDIDENINIGDEVIIYSQKLPIYNYNKFCNSNSEQMAVLNYNSLNLKKIY